LETGFIDSEAAAAGLSLQDVLIKVRVTKITRVIPTNFLNTLLPPSLYCKRRRLEKFAIFNVNIPRLICFVNRANKIWN
jgi:hypothetical protein